MKLATHNTMSYLRPKQWWARLFPWFAKCQSKDYKKQYEMGARGFDLRVLWDENNILEFRHGMYRYSGNDVWDVLDFANDKNMIVRVLLDMRDYITYDNADEQRALFFQFCKKIEEKYPNIGFYGGSGIYKFKNPPVFTEIARYSSMTSLFPFKGKFWEIIDDWCPWIYAKLKNKKHIKQYSNLDDTNYLVIDFI